MAKRRKPGDRKDGELLRKIDPMHYICPILYPNRCDNEAFMSECIDLTNAEAYLAQKNADNPSYRYNTFQLIITAMVRCLTLRPKMNRFIANRNMYQRNEITASFVVKKQFRDEAKEGLAYLHLVPEDTLDTIHEKVREQIDCTRSGKGDASSDSMDLFNRMPRFLSKALVRFICVLDRYGRVPYGLIATDPYYSSVLLTNLGSIKLHAGYHHLTNWGTNSVFLAVGEIKKRPFFDEEGHVTMRQSVDLGLTIDERLADGYYYSKTVRLLKTLLENPVLLEQPLKQEVDY